MAGNIFSIIALTVSFSAMCMITIMSNDMHSCSQEPGSNDSEESD